jgi:hypothetical protein
VILTGYSSSLPALEIFVFDFVDHSLMRVPGQGPSNLTFNFYSKKLQKVIFTSYDSSTAYLHILDLRSQSIETISANKINLPVFLKFGIFGNSYLLSGSFFEFSSDTELIFSQASSNPYVGLTPGALYKVNLTTLTSKIILNGVREVWHSEDGQKVFLCVWENNPNCLNGADALFLIESEKVIPLSGLADPSLPIKAIINSSHGQGLALESTLGEIFYLGKRPNNGPQVFRLSPGGLTQSVACAGIEGTPLGLFKGPEEAVYLLNADPARKLMSIYSLQDGACHLVNQFPNEFWAGIDRIISTKVGVGFAFISPKIGDPSQEIIFVPSDGRPPILLNPGFTEVERANGFQPSADGKSLFLLAQSVQDHGSYLYSFQLQ